MLMHVTPSLQVYLFAEALAEGAVKMGMPSALAHSIASQTVLVSSIACVLLFLCSNISTFLRNTVFVRQQNIWTHHNYFGLYSIWCRVLGNCYVSPGSIRLSSALRSALRVEQPSTGFTPWSRAVWGRRPWAPWNLPLREPGSSAESEQKDPRNNGCSLPFDYYSIDLIQAFQQTDFLAQLHHGTQRQRRTCHLFFVHFFPFLIN